nr:FliH/SctL family protein [uncultured Actinotalea sp.]
MSPETGTLAPAAARTAAPAAAASVVGGTAPAHAPTTAFRPAFLPVASAATAEAAERARSAGFAAGFAAGARAAAEETAALRTRLAAEHLAAEGARQDAVGGALGVLERAVAAAAGRTAPVVDDARRTLLEAALALAEAVLQRELTPGPAGARALLDRALAVPADLGVHTIRLHPADLAHVRAVLASGERSLPDGVALVADPRLRPGDAVSEHPTGYLDAQISTALDRARRALLEDQS